MKLRWVILPGVVLLAAVIAAALLRPKPEPVSGGVREVGPDGIVVQDAKERSLSDVPRPTAPVITEDEAVRRAINDPVPVASVEADGTIRAGQNHFRQVFGPNGLHVETPQGNLSLALKEMKIADESILPATGSAILPSLQNAGRATVVYSRDRVTEKYLPEPGQVEQVFVLDRSLEPLRSRGPLTIRLAYKTALKPVLTTAERSAEEGPEPIVEFRNHGGGAALTLGGATAIDAAGRKATLAYSIGDGTLDMTLDAGYLARAEFPLTVDPTLGGQINIDSTNNPKVQPDVAYSPTADCYLVTWELAGDIYCKVVTPTGEPVPAAGSSAILVDGSVDSSTRPRVSRSNTNQFMIVWQRLVGGYQQVWGAFVTVTNNVPSAAAPFSVFSPGAYNAGRPDIGFSTTTGRYIIPFEYDFPGPYSIAASIRNTDGSQFTAVWVANSVDVEERPAIVGYGSDPLGMAYVRKVGAGLQGDIWCTSISGTGTITGAQTLLSNNVEDERDPDVGQYPGSSVAYVTWARQAGPGLDYDIVARRVDFVTVPGAPAPGGIVFGVETSPATNTEFPRVATADAGGAQRAIISYQTTGFPIFTNWNIEAQVYNYSVSPNNPTPALEILPLAGSPTDEVAPALGVKNVAMEALAVWQSNNSPGSTHYIRGQRVKLASIPGFELAIQSTTTTEGSIATATFTVVLKTAPAGPVNIPFSLSDNTQAQLSGDGSTFGAGFTHVFGAGDWNIPKTVYVRSVDDFVDEDNVTYTVISGDPASAFDGNYNNLTAADVSDVVMTNVDNDTAGVTITPTTGLQTSEWGNSTAYTVVLQTQPAAGFEVYFRATVAALDQDEGLVSCAAAPTPSSTTVLTFTTANWNAPQAIIVTGVDDALTDGPQTYSVTHGIFNPSDPKFVALSPAAVSVTNLDNETAGFTITPASLTVNESPSSATFTIQLNTVPKDYVYVTFTSSDPTEGTVNPTYVYLYPADALTPKTITVTGVQDFIADGNQPFSIITALGYSSDPAYSSLNPPDVSVTCFETAATTGPIRVRADSDFIVSEIGSPSNFLVDLLVQPTASIVVTWNISATDTGEIAIAPFGQTPGTTVSLTFTTANWNIPQTATISGVNDALSDNYTGAFTINGATITSPDPAYNGISPPPITGVFNFDDETLGYSPAFPSPWTGFEVNEGQTTTYIVNLMVQPTSTIHVTITSSDATEARVSSAAAPGASTTVILTFTPVNWNTPQTVTITGVQDNIIDGTQTVNLNFTNTSVPAGSDPRFDGVGSFGQTVTVVDVNTPSFIISPLTGLTTTEANGLATFSVRLSMIPTTNVIIPFFTSDPTEGLLSRTGGAPWSSSVGMTFTTVNWNSNQTVWIQGQDDLFFDRNLPYTILTGPSISGDGNFNNLNPPDVSVTNTDNDRAGIVISKVQGAISAGTPGGIWGQGASNPYDPFNTYYHDSRAQFVLLASELTAAGFGAGSVLSSVRLRPSEVHGMPNLANFRIRMQHTALATSTSFVTSGWTNVYGPTNVVVTSANVGAFMDLVLTTPFTWNGASNLLIDLSRDATNWITGGGMFVRTGLASRTYAAYSDSGYVWPFDTMPGTTFSHIPEIEFNMLETAESGTSAQFTIRLLSQPRGDVSFLLSSGDTTEGLISSAAFPASTASFTVSFSTSNWNVVQTFTVRGNDDPNDDGDIIYPVVRGATSTADPDYVFTSSTILVRNLNDDVAGVSIDAGVDGVVVTSESGTDDFFTVVLTTPPLSSVFIPVQSLDTTEGMISTDAVTPLTNLTLNFTVGNWNTPQTVFVHGRNDTITDPAQAYQIQVSSPTGASDPGYQDVAVQIVGGTNNDNEPEIRISVNPAESGDAAADEDGGTGAFVVVRTGDSGSNLVVSYSIGGTAANTADYATLSGTVTIPAASSSVLIPITPVNDQIDEDDFETVVLTLTGGGTLNLSGPSSETVQIADNDTRNIIIDNVGGIVTGEQPHPTYPATDTFTVRLATQPQSNFNVEIPFTSVAAEGLLSAPGFTTVVAVTLTFTTANWSTPQVVTVTSVDDENQETGGVANYTIITGACISSDPKYSNFNIADLAAQNYDNDPELRVSMLVADGGDSTADESGGTGVFVLLRTGDTSVPLPVTYSLSGSALAEDYASLAPATFPVGSTRLTLTVTPVNDSIAEDPETLTFTLTGGGNVIAGQNSGTVTITSADDIADILVFISGPDTVTGEQPSATRPASDYFTVRLNTQPQGTNTVTIPFTSGATGEGLLTGPGGGFSGTVVLSFSTSNWSVLQTVTVTAQNDTLTDGNITYGISVGGAAGDPKYAGMTDPNISVTNYDNEPELRVSLLAGDGFDGSATETAGDTGRFVILKTGSSAASVTFSLTGGATNTTDYATLSTTVNIPAASTSVLLTVTPVDDALTEGSETVVLTLTGGGTLVPGQISATVTIIDNDSPGVVINQLGGVVTGEQPHATQPATDTFSVRLQSQPSPGNTVQVPLGSGNPAEGLLSVGAAAPAASTTLTFNDSNWNTPVVVIVTSQNDVDTDIGGFTDYTITVGPCTSGDPNYNNLDPGVNFTARNYDNEPELRIYATVPDAYESGFTGQFTIQRTGDTVLPLNGVTFTVSAPPATPGAAPGGGADYQTIAGPLSIPANSDSVIIFVNPFDDLIDENDEPVTLTLTGGGTVVIAAATVQIHSDDVAGVTVNTGDGLFTSENLPSTDTFTVVLNTQPTADVTLQVALPPPSQSQARVSSEAAPGQAIVVTLTFTAANWNTPQIVTVHGQDDTVKDPGFNLNQAFSINNGPCASTDPKYSGLAVPAGSDVLTAFNLDNDPVVTISALALPATESPLVARNFTFTKTGEPTDSVTVFFTVSGTAIPGADYNPLGGSVTFSGASGLVAVSPLNDAIAEDPETVIVTLDPGSYTVGGGPASISIQSEDAAGVTVNTLDGIATSENLPSSDTFTVVLDSEPTSEVQVPISLPTASDQSEAELSSVGSPIPGASLVLVFDASNWATAQVVTVSGKNDAVEDPGFNTTRTYTIEIGQCVSADGKYSPINPADITTATSLDNDPEISITASVPSVVEDSASVGRFTVTRTGNPAGTTISWTITGSATPGTDYVTLPVSVVFAGGEMSRDIDVDPNADPTSEPNKTVIATLSAGSYTLLSSSDTVTIVDDDSPGVTVSTAAVTTSENGTTATFTVVLNTIPSGGGTVTVPVYIDQGQPQPDEGYVSSVGSPVPSTSLDLVFSPGIYLIPQVVTVHGRNDDLTESPSPTYTITLGATSASVDVNYIGIDPADVTVTNTDNEPEVTVELETPLLSASEAGPTARNFKFHRTGDTNIPLAVAFTVTGTAAQGSDFAPISGVVNFAAGAPGQSDVLVSVSPVNDAFDELDETVIVTLVAGSYTIASPSAATMTLLDNDTAGVFVAPLTGLTTTEGGGTASFIVVLTSRPGADVLIPVASSDPLEGVVSSVATPTSAAAITLTFTTSNWNTAQFVTIHGVDDNVTETLAQSSFTILTGDVSVINGSDALYDAITASQIEDVSVVNTDDEPKVTIVADAPTVPEAGPPATFTIFRTGTTGSALTVNFSVSGTATPGSDYTSLGSSVTFSGASTTLVVAPIQGPIDEANETVVVTLSSGSYAIGTASSATMTIIDDDTAGVTVDALPGLTTNENGGTATFTVQLQSPPSANVTIPVTSSDATEGRVSVGAGAPAAAITLTFDSTNWNVPQVVTVTGINDPDLDFNVPYAVVVGDPASSDPFYDALGDANAPDVSLTNNDNEPEVKIEVSAATGAEPSTAASFTLTRTGDTANPLAVSLTPSGTAAPADYSLSPAVIPAGSLTVQVLVTPVDDSLAESPETLTLTIAAGGYTITSPAAGAVTINDNDTVGFSILPGTTLTTTEGGGTAAFTVRLTSQPLGNVVLPLSSSEPAEGLISAGGAPAASLGLTFTVADWNTFQTVTVTGQNDPITDGLNPYQIVTGAPSGGDAAYNALNPFLIPDVNVENSDNEPEVTISVSDPSAAEPGGLVNQGAFTISRTGSTGSPLSVLVSAGGSASAAGDYLAIPSPVVIPAGSPFVNVFVNVLDDAEDEDDETVDLTLVPDAAYSLTGATVSSLTIVDEDAAGVTVVQTGGTTATSESGASDTFSVVLTSKPTSDVLIPLSISNGEADLDYVSLLFTPANWNTPVTVTVTGLNDAVTDPAAAPNFSVLLGPCSSADGRYSGMAIASFAGTNADNEPEVTIFVSLPGAAEPGGAGNQGQFTVARTGDSTLPLTVFFTVAGSALSGSDYVAFAGASPYQVAIPALALSETVLVNPIDDLVQEPLETVVATLYTGLYTIASPSSATIFIADDDSAGVQVQPLSGLATSENGTADFFTVRLNTQPADFVTIPFTSSAPAEAKLTLGLPGDATASVTLTFTALNWNVLQTVTVVGQNDAGTDIPALSPFTISPGVTVSTDSFYNALPGINSVTGTNADNEPEVSIVVGPGSISEGNLAPPVAPTPGTFTISRTGDTTNPLVLNVLINTSGASPATPGSDYSANPDVTTATFTITGASSTVTITPVADDTAELPENVVLQIEPPTSPGDYTVTSSSTATLVIPNNDSGGVAVEKGVLTVFTLLTSEAGTTDAFTVRLTTPPLSDVTIPVFSTDDTECRVSSAGSPTPSSSLVLTFTMTDWNVPQTVTVTGVNDPITDPTLGAFNASVVVGDPASLDPFYDSLSTVSLIDLENTDNEPEVFVTAPTPAGDESLPVAGTFLITRTGELSSDMTVNYTITGSAASGIDFVALGNSVLIPSGSSSVALGVTPLDDFLAEGDETVVLTVVSGGYTIGSTPVATVTITENDFAGIGVSPVSGPTGESGGTASFSVALTSRPQGDVVLPVSTTDVSEGLLSTGTGAQTTSVTLTFTTANWNVFQVVTVHGQNDPDTDGDITYLIDIGDPSSPADTTYDALTASGTADVVVTNTDNEPELTLQATQPTASEQGPISATFTVTRTGVLTADLIVNISVGGTAVSGTDYSAVGTLVTIPTGLESTTVVITPVDDALLESTETVTLTLQPGAYTVTGTGAASCGIADNDTPGIAIFPPSNPATSENGDSTTFTVVLTSIPTANVTVYFTSSDPSEGVPDVASVTFSPSSAFVPQTITVTGMDDALLDGAIPYAIVTGATSSTDPAYDGLFPPDVLLVNTDNDLAGIVITPPAGLSTTESGGTATFTVALSSAPIGKVTLLLSSPDSTEGTVSPSTLVFTPADALTPQVVTVTGVDDTIPDGNVIYAIVTAALVSADPAYSGLNPPDIAVTNVENDAVGFAIVPSGQLITNESGTTAFFTVALTTTPTADVTLPVTSGDTTEGLVSSTGSPTPGTTLTLTFTSADWNVPQTVTVTGQSDGDTSNTPYAILTGPAVSSDDAEGANKYNGQDPADVPVLNVDNTSFAFTISPSGGLTTTEQGGTATFQIVLNSTPTGDVTLALSTSNPAEGLISTGAGAPTTALTLTFTTADALLPQVVTVTGVNDSAVDDNVNYSIVTAAAVSSDSNYNGVNPADVTVTNLDDEILVPPTISLNPSSLQYSANEGGSNPPSRTVVLSNTGGASFDWSATAPPWMTLNGSAVISGTLAPQASVNITAAVNITGLLGGGYSGSINVTSPTAGSNSPQNVSVSLIIIPPPPAMTITSPGSPATTGSSPITIDGTATNSPTSITWVNQTTGQSGLGTGASVWSADVPLLPGNNVISIYGWNSGGIGSATLTVFYTAETAPPVVTPTATSFIAPSANFTISGTAADPGSGVSAVSWLNVTTGVSGPAGGTNNWSATIPLTNGTNTVIITAVDGVGNAGSTTVTIDFSAPADTTAPAVLILAPTDEPNYTTNVSPIVLGGTAFDLSGVTAVTWVNEGTNGRGTATGTDTWIATIPLANGNNVIRVTGRDPQGNFSTTLILVSFRPPPGDSGPPVISIQSPTTSNSISTPLSTSPLGGTTLDNGILGAVVWVNAATGQSGTANGLAIWSVTSVPLAKGLNPITVFAFDTSGNSSAATITIDYTVPPPPPDGTQAGHCGLTGLDALGLLAALWAARRRRRKC